MATVITLPTYTDTRGSLTVLDKVLPFEIKRIYWIYDLTEILARNTVITKVGRG